MMAVCAAGFLSAADLVTMINDGTLSIQTIFTDTGIGWPGVDSGPPVDVALAGGRVWLIRPGALISLDGHGRIDTGTMLSLYASRTAAWSDGPWTPADGVLCSDGIWRGFRLTDSRFLELDPSTGSVVGTEWVTPVPDTLVPAAGGRIVGIAGADVLLIDPIVNGRVTSRALSVDGSLLSQRAVSTADGRVAWLELSGTGLNITDIDHPAAGPGRRELGIPGTPPASPWSMCWSGGYLVLAYPGELAVMDPDTGAEIMSVRHPRIPERWYRVIGSGEGILIHSPEKDEVVLVGPESAGSHEIESVPGGVDTAGLVRRHGLDAGETLERSGRSAEAERYWGWLIPLVREQRSRNPLDPFWAELEADITTRRTRLREMF